jgi:2-dehydro-3-deoxy-D-arabinonate dehydratase
VEDLAAYLFRCQSHPCGAVLSTGTGVVPDLDFTLDTGDVVAIRLEGVGTLTNTVERGLVGGDRVPPVPVLAGGAGSAA